MKINFNNRQYTIDPVDPEDESIILVGDDDQIVIPLQPLLDKVHDECAVAERDEDGECFYRTDRDSVRECLSQMVGDYVFDNLDSGNFKIETE